MPTLSETLKQKVDELQLERHLNEAVEAGEKAMRQAVTKAGEFAHQNREKAESFLDRAAATIDEKTEGKYADKVKKVADQVKAGVSRLADQRESDASAAQASSPPADESDAQVDAEVDPEPSAKDSSARPASEEPTKFDWDGVTDDA